MSLIYTLILNWIVLMAYRILVIVERMGPTQSAIKLLRMKYAIDSSCLTMRLICIQPSNSEYYFEVILMSTLWFLYIRLNYWQCAHSNAHSIIWLVCEPKYLMSKYKIRTVTMPNNRLRRMLFSSLCNLTISNPKFVNYCNWSLDFTVKIAILFICVLRFRTNGIKATH